MLRKSQFWYKPKPFAVDSQNIYSVDIITIWIIEVIIIQTYTVGRKLTTNCVLNITLENWHIFISTKYIRCTRVIQHCVLKLKKQL